MGHCDQNEFQFISENLANTGKLPCNKFSLLNLCLGDSSQFEILSYI